MVEFGALERLESSSGSIMWFRMRIFELHYWWHFYVSIVVWIPPFLMLHTFFVRRLFMHSKLWLLKRCAIPCDSRYFLHTTSSVRSFLKLFFIHFWRLNYGCRSLVVSSFRFLQCSVIFYFYRSFWWWSVRRILSIRNNQFLHRWLISLLLNNLHELHPSVR